MPSKPKTFFSTVLLIILILLPGCMGKNVTQLTPTSSSLTASLNELQGTVKIKQPDQSNYTIAASGMTLQVAGGVRTAEDGRVRLDLSSGSLIRLAPLTTFILTSNTLADGNLFTHIKMEAGRIWVILNGGSLDVETPSGLATVRGSLLSVWIDPDTNDVWVSCVEGWCQAENPSGVLDLIAGQGAILYHFDPNSTVPPPPPMLRFLTPEEIQDFLSNNPEAAGMLESIIATASAFPTLTGTATPTPTFTATATPIATATPTQIHTYAKIVFTYMAGPTGTLTNCNNPYAVEITDPDSVRKVWVHFEVIDSADFSFIRNRDVSLSSESTRPNYWNAYFAIRTQFGGTVPQDYTSRVIWYFVAMDATGVTSSSDLYTFDDNLKCSEGY